MHKADLFLGTKLLAPGAAQRRACARRHIPPTASTPSARATSATASQRGRPRRAAAASAGVRAGPPQPGGVAGAMAGEREGERSLEICADAIFKLVFLRAAALLSLLVLLALLRSSPVPLVAQLLLLSQLLPLNAAPWAQSQRHL